MRRVAAILALLAGLLPSTAIAQRLPDLPSNTVYGRLGIGPGPGQALPFSVLTAQVLTQMAAHTVKCNVNSSTGVSQDCTAFNLAGPPSISGTFADTPLLTTILVNNTATSATQIESVATFRLTSGVGSGHPTTAGKSTLGTEAICNSGSAQCGAFGAVITTNTGFAVTTITALLSEFDFNQASGTHCDDGDPHATGVWCGYLLMTGAGNKQINFGLAIAGNLQIRNGVLFQQDGPINNSIVDYSASVVSWNDKGSHTHGLYANNATYSGNFITGPSATFVVTPAGALTAVSLTTSGNITTTVATKTLVLKQGANGAVGTFTCTSGGSITVTNSNVAITDTIIISLNTAGGTITTAPALNAITASTSFVAKCATNDTAVYNYAIIKNAA